MEDQSKLKQMNPRDEEQTRKSKETASSSKEESKNDDKADTGAMFPEMMLNPLDQSWIPEETFEERFSNFRQCRTQVPEHNRRTVKKELIATKAILVVSDEDKSPEPETSYISKSFIELKQSFSNDSTASEELQQASQQLKDASPDSENVSQAFENIFQCELEIYNMENPRRGTALIFNQENFEGRLQLSSRNGSSKDTVDIHHTLMLYGFTPKVFNDTKSNEIEEILNTVVLEDHSNEDMFVCVYLSHGEEGGVYSTDKFFPTKKLWQNFTDTSCPTLAGKPKIFIIQACRGTKLDKGKNTKVKSSSSKAPLRTKTSSAADGRDRYSYSEEEKIIPQTLPPKISDTKEGDEGKTQTKQTLITEIISEPIKRENNRFNELKDFEKTQIANQQVCPEELLEKRRHSEPFAVPDLVVTSHESNLKIPKEVDGLQYVFVHQQLKMNNFVKDTTNLESFYSNIEELEAAIRDNESITDSSEHLFALVNEDARDSTDSQASSASESQLFLQSNLEKRRSLPEALAQANPSLLSSNRRLNRDRTISENLPRRRLSRSKHDRLDAKSGSNEEDEYHCDPVHEIPDTLIAYSTVQGYFSWRNPKDGSWFIQALCKLLQECQGGDIFDLLHEVNRRVAYDYQSKVPHNDKMNAKKQSCCLASTLTKELNFKRKTATTTL